MPLGAPGDDLRPTWLHRGPLVFSYAIGGSWLKLAERGKGSDRQVYPQTAWNYALVISASLRKG